MKLKLLLLLCLTVSLVEVSASQKDTFVPCNAENVPKNYEELWSDYDPTAEPLEVEVLKEWEQDNVIMKVIRYRAFRYKGENAMMAAVYGYPKGAKKLPGLVQMHGGGQFAHYNAVLTNAKRGYVTISVAWGGRINAPGYMVDANARVAYINKEPKALVTTNYGVIDGFHAPSTHPGIQSNSVKPSEWSIDPVPSPRNACYFLWTVAGRRAITFLQAQKEVDPNKIGVYGHSMGGKLTAHIAGSDSRIKAAVPSCGGFNEFAPSEEELQDLSARLLFNNMYNSSFTSHIACPILYLNPINDFNGVTDNSRVTFESMQTKDYGIVSSPHRSHGDNGEHFVSGQLWFDAKLKGTFDFPSNPKTKLKLGKIPTLTVEVDDRQKILEVDVYYTQDGVVYKGGNDRNNRKSRYWHYAKPVLKGGKWVAELPVEATDRELWAYAHVKYALDKTVAGAGYGYQNYKSKVFHLSSVMDKAMPEELVKAGAEILVKPSLVIEDFGKNWKKGYYEGQENRWSYSGHQLYSLLFKAPSEDAKMVIELKSAQKNRMMISLDSYFTMVEIKGGGKLQTITLSREDFKDKKKNVIPSWDRVLIFTLSANEALSSAEKSDKKSNPYDKWRGPHPEFKVIKWVE